MRGGLYTQFGIPVGERWSGYYGIIYIVTKMTLAMYSLSFAQYFIALVPGAPEKAVALGVATFFIGLAFFGVDLAAKVQNLLVIALIAALVVFAVVGVPYVDLGNYFSNADGMFLSDGVSAASRPQLLTWASLPAVQLLFWTPRLSVRTPQRIFPLLS